MAATDQFLPPTGAVLLSFLRFNERQVLPGSGKLSKKTVEAKALVEYEKSVKPRRALLERESQATQLNALFEASKTLPQPKDAPSPGRSKK